MSKSELPQVPGAWESRAFFAALMAACRGDDKAAGDILRQIADSMTKDFTLKEVESRGKATR